MRLWPLLTIIIFCAACSEGQFGAGSNDTSSAGGKTDDTPTGDDDDSLNDGPPNQSGPCTKNGVVNLKFPEKIQACIDEGNLYNFDTNSCTAMTKAKFTCDFDHVIAEVEALDLNPAGMKKGRDENGLVIGCGQSADGKTIVGQWWTNPSEDSECSYNAGGTFITTGCYVRVEGEAPPKPTSQEEIAKRVLECMNEN
jgi:hypothetical protein